MFILRNRFSPAIVLAIVVSLLLAFSTTAHAKVFPVFQARGNANAPPGQTVLVSSPLQSNPVRVGSAEFGDPCSRSTTQLIKYKCQLNALREDPDPARTILKALDFQGDELKTTKIWIARIASKGATTADELSKPGVIEAYTKVLGNLDGMKNYNLLDLQNAIQRRYSTNIVNSGLNLRSGKDIRLEDGKLWSGGKSIDLTKLSNSKITALIQGGFKVEGTRLQMNLKGNLGKGTTTGNLRSRIQIK